LPTPILRGASKVFWDEDRGEIARQFVFWDGLTDLWVKRIFRDTSVIYMEEVLGTAYEALRIARWVARHGGAPGVDFLMTVEVASDRYDDVLSVLPNTPGGGRLRFQEFPQQGCIGEDLVASLKGLMNDLLNAAGLPVVAEFSLQDAALR